MNTNELVLLTLLRKVNRGTFEGGSLKSELRTIQVYFR